MDAMKYMEMMQDHHILDLKKMGYKYSGDDVMEMIAVMKTGAYQEISLPDFSGKKNLVYVPGILSSVSDAAKILLRFQGTELYSRRALENEIVSTFEIEQIETSRDSVREILAGKAPRDEKEQRILGMKRGFEFIADKRNRISAVNMRQLYEIAINPYLTYVEDRLTEGMFYRDGDVKVVNKLQEKKIHTGIAAEKIERMMEQFFSFIDGRQSMNDLEKAAAIHFYIGYIHPYYDGNGRMARLMHLWYLLQEGYSAALFLPFSSLIQQSKNQYNKAYELTEENAKISGVVDITPFLAYFNNAVYRYIGEETLVCDALDRFDGLLKEGKITSKEKELFHFVLSNYGSSEFSTKQLEKDFGNAAYATIRTFVLKLTEYGLLEAHPYGSRTKYCIAAPHTAAKCSGMKA